MRLARLLIALTVLSAPLNPALRSMPAAAQAPAAAAPLPCSGMVNIVRVSDIKPGMMQKFMDAVAAQTAWYKGAGAPDKIELLHLMVQDPATKAWSISQTKALTNHIVPAGRKGPAHDAGYDAFVAMFKDSSTITSEYLTCASDKM